MSSRPPLSTDPIGPTHYELLQLPLSATAQDLRQAFRSLSKRYHPDTTSLPADQAEEGFRRLQRAYAVLSDPDSRRAYDAGLLSRVARSPVPVPAAARPPGRPIPVRRPLSGGEWFALLLLAMALLLSLVLGIGLAWARGAALVRWPSWWDDPTLAAMAVPSGPEKAAAEPPDQREPRDPREPAGPTPSSPLAVAPTMGQPPD